MILYFENRNGIRREIARPQTAPEAHELISQFLKEHNYETYYTRTYLCSNGTEILFDVGSYSEFFYLYKEEGWTDNWVDELYERG